MRGTPWLRFVLMTIALALTAVPIWLLMRSAAPPPAPNSAPVAQAERELTLEIVSAPAAHSIRLSYLGQELLPESSGGRQLFRHSPGAFGFSSGSGRHSDVECNRECCAARAGLE